MRIQAVFYADPDDYPPIINGTRLLTAAGYCVDILCRESGHGLGAHYPSTASINRMHIESGSTWKLYVEFVRQVIRQADPQAQVYVGHDMHGLLPARILATRHGRPLVYHCHDFSEDNSRLLLGGRMVKAFERRFARTADLVIVPDQERAVVVHQALRLRRPPLVVANAPLAQFAGSGEGLHVALAERGYRWSKILFRQGRIGPNHAIEATLRSLPFWQSTDWGFAIMGLGDADYCQRLSTVANQLGVADRFVILPAVSYDELSRFTPGASAGHALYEPTHVNNIYITTASNKLMEYMAAGIPVLVSDRSGLRALVEHYHCGVTADESSPERIAAAVNTLLGDPESASHMGMAGRRAFEEVFCYDKQFAPALAAFHYLVKRPSRPRFG